MEFLLLTRTLPRSEDTEGTPEQELSTIAQGERHRELHKIPADVTEGQGQDHGPEQEFDGLLGDVFLETGPEVHPPNPPAPKRNPSAQSGAVKMPFAAGSTL